jgi:hypothetical protein
MSKHRRAAKIDQCQPGFVKRLRKLPGVTVAVSHDDILVGYKGKTFWIELKDEDEAVSKKTGLLLDSALKDSQKDLLRDWTGHYAVCWKFEQILEQIGFNQ